MGWYLIKNPLTVGQLKRIGVRRFWRYDGSISVLVKGVRRVALKITVDGWHIGTAVDRHGGPEVYISSGSIGEEQANWLDLQIV